MNKQTLDERFEDYNEPTEQEEIWSDEIHNIVLAKRYKRSL